MKTKSIILFILLLLFITPLTFSQSTLGGMHGHLIVPDANPHAKNALTLGTGYNPSKYRFRYPLEEMSDNGELFMNISMNYLEFLDITLNVSRILNVPETRNGIGDRSINIKTRIIKESTKWPAIAFALEVPGGTNNWVSSNCILTTKTFSNFVCTIGYGVPLVLARKVNGGIGSEEYYGSIFDLKIAKKPNNYLNGPLASVAYQFEMGTTLLSPNVEFDGEKFNLGFIAKLEQLSVTLYFPGVNSVAGGIYYSYILK